MTNTLILGDCLEKMKDIPDESIDLVLTDPPYKIVSGGMTNKLGGIFNRDLWPNTKTGKMFDYNSIKFSEWLPDVYRIVKKNTHTYIMTSSRNLKELMVESERVGFNFQNLLVWDKCNVTPNRYYMIRTEFILLLKKGSSKTINNAGTHNIIRIKNPIGKKRHPTEKPVELLSILLSNSTKISDLVFDPFMGCGSTGLACKNLNRNFIGIEIDEKYYKIAQERIGL